MIARIRIEKSFLYEDLELEWYSKKNGMKADRCIELTMSN